jgi:uroporphyrinogen decarboxylase
LAKGLQYFASPFSTPAGADALFARRKEKADSMGRFNDLVLNAAQRLAMPIAVYPGATLIGATVRDIVTNPRTQRDASAALQARYHAPFALSAMDLSVEAEAFGCQIQMTDDEIPTAVSCVVANLEQAKALPVPQVGTKRTGVYLESVRLLRQLSGKPLVLGGCIGPFSLAGRLVGLSEACGLTLDHPELMHTVLDKCAEFLAAYVQAFKAAGADGVIMAEPAAGLLSPRGLSAFSAAYIKRIVQAVEDGRFQIVLHNCAAKLIHLPAVLESGPSAFHFGAPMVLVGALAKAPPTTVLCGNLDPSAMFLQSTPDQLTAKTSELLAATQTHRNFVISSGCDVPHGSPLANLDAFYAAAAAQP